MGGANAKSGLPPPMGPRSWCEDGMGQNRRGGNFFFGPPHDGGGLTPMGSLTNTPEAIVEKVHFFFTLVPNSFWDPEAVLRMHS